MKRNTQSQASNNTRTIFTALIVAGIFFLVKYFHRQEPEDTPVKQEKTRPRVQNNGTLSHLEYPAQKPGEQIVFHKGFTLSYNEEHEQANWVAYKLKKKGTANFRRTDKFLADPMVTSGSADDADYNGSGYDRGHLAPAEDMDWSKATMAESFYFSNISPQQPHFNRGVWRRLEELVRFWAEEYDSIFIVTGPVLAKGLPVIGHSKVSVPAYYFKAVLRYDGNDAEGIGFVLANEPSAATLKRFAVPVDSVEKLTGIDLYPQLPDEMESSIEAGLNINNWQWVRRRN